MAARLRRQVAGGNGWGEKVHFSRKLTGFQKIEKHPIKVTPSAQAWQSLWQSLSL